jgi:ankyrin repeat protein
MEARDEYGSTPLIAAAIHGMLEVLVALAGNGANLNAVDQNLQSALHWAAILGRDNCATQLCKSHGTGLKDPLLISL